MDENPCAERHSWEKRDIFRMTDAFLRGLNRKSEHAVNIIHVRDEQITPCRGCFGCRQRGGGQISMPSPTCTGMRM